MKRFFPGILLLVCLSLAFFVFYPGTSGYFLFDDTINIVENLHLQIHSLDFQSLKQAAFSGDAGMLGRPLSVLSFALNYYFNGLNPFYFKLTNIIIHLLNGVGIYMLTILLLRALRLHAPNAPDQDAARWLSLAVAAAWLLHPLTLTGVLYIVQRMTSLAALFTLLGLIAYVYGRLRIDSGKKWGWSWILASFLVLTPLAALSKENGALLPVFMLLIEFVLFRFQAPTLSAKRGIMALFGITVLLPASALLIYTIYNPAWVTAGYAIRDFTLPERLMTEARILWFYVQNILAPNMFQLGMYHDDIPISKNLLEPPTTLFACIGILLSVTLAIFFRKKHPIAAFGVLFFLVGHSIESTALALEIVHEHRNYLPMFGILLILFYYLLYPLRHLQSLKIRRVIAIFFILVLAGVTFLRATQWGDPVVMKEMGAKHHPESIRANIDVGSLYGYMPATSQAEADEYYQRAREHFSKAVSLSSTDTLGLFGLIGLNSRNSIPVEDAWVQELAKRIEQYPFAPSTGNSLASLEKCLYSGGCAHSKEVMEQLIQAALHNPTLHGKAKIQVLFVWSDFLFGIKHDRDAAKNAAYQAVAVYPEDIESRLTLIKILINMEQITDAKTQLTLVRQLDKRQEHEGSIKEIEDWIATNNK